MLSKELKEHNERITPVVRNWLTAEVATSSDPNDINAYLNDYEAAIRGFKGGFDHPENFAWSKLNSHIGRLQNDYEIFADTDPEDKDYDKIAAKIIFDGLMQVSGAYRDQCYVQARDAEDYMARRQKVIGINIDNSVSNRLIDLLPQNGDFTGARMSTQSLGEQVKRVSEIGERAVRTLVNRVKFGYDLHEPDSRSSQEMIASQFNWLNLTLDALILVTKCKDGDLAAVPSLEPISITKQSGQLHYPLREPVDWAEVMAAA